MKKNVTLGDTLFLSIVLSNYLREARGRADLKEVYKVCTYLDTNLEQKSFESFRKAYYRAKRKFQGVSLTVT